MTPLRFLLTALVVEAAGLALLSRLARERRSGPGMVGLGFVTGVLAVALWGQLLLWTRVPVTLLTMLIGPLACIASGRWSFLREAVWKRPPWPSALLILAAAFLLYGAFSFSLPGFDPETFYGFKAKSIVHQGTIWNEDFTDPSRLHQAHRRPLLLPLIYSEVYLGAGSFDGLLLRVWFALFQIAALAAMYDALRARMERFEASLAVAVYSWCPALWRDAGGAVSAYADAPLSMVFLFALMSETRLAVFMATAGALLKDEGMAFLIPFALIRGPRAALIPSAVAAAWLVTASFLPRDSDFLPANFLHPRWEAIPFIVRHLLSEMVATKHWSLIWYIILAVLLLRIRRLTREDARWGVPVGLQLALYVGVWMTFPAAQLSSLMVLEQKRLLLHVTPMAWTWACWRASQGSSYPLTGRTQMLR